MNGKSTIAAATAALALFAGCEKPAANPGYPPPFPAPSAGDHAPRGIGVLSLDVYLDGSTLHLLTAETRQGSAALIHTRSDDGGETWTPGVRVDEGLPPAHSPHHGMDPQIVASGKNVLAVWMSPGSDKWGGGPLATALSSDGGGTWRAGPNPADDGSTDGHGFLDIAADARRFHLTWLDSRDGLRGLRYTSSADAGESWSPNSTVDTETCECCANTIVPAENGEVAILYRDKAPRDMRVGISGEAGKAWRVSAPAGDFDWQFDGCPHTGGGLIAKGSSLFATVWTGHSDQAGLYFVHSNNLGVSWNGPTLIDPAGVHSDIAMDEQGSLVVVWGSSRASNGSIWKRISTDLGKTWTADAQLSPSGYAATHPRVIAIAGGFRTFWTEHSGSGPSVWKSATIPR